MAWGWGKTDLELNLTKFEVEGPTFASPPPHPDYIGVMCSLNLKIVGL